MINDLFDDLDFPDLFTRESAVPNLTPAEEELIRMLPSELKAINARIDRLETALNTQTLRLELERAKRQKLRIAMKQHRHETPAFHPEAQKQLIETNLMRQEAINYQLGGDIDRLNTLAFRCLSRMQQLMSFVLPCVLVTPNDYPDVTCLLEEIGRTLQQLCVHRQPVPYV